MADWQPIDDDTPKNRRIMLWVPYGPTFGHWDRDENNRNPQPFWRYEGVLRVTNMRAKPPTHWQPVPAAPKGTKSNAAS